MLHHLPPELRIKCLWQAEPIDILNCASVSAFQAHMMKEWD